MVPESLDGIWGSESPIELCVSASNHFYLVSAQTSEDSQEPADWVPDHTFHKGQNDGHGQWICHDTGEVTHRHQIQRRAWNTNVAWLLISIVAVGFFQLPLLTLWGKYCCLNLYPCRLYQLESNIPSNDYHFSVFCPKIDTCFSQNLSLFSVWVSGGLSSQTVSPTGTGPVSFLIVHFLSC